jgi:hypothetical protein
MMQIKLNDRIRDYNNLLKVLCGWDPTPTYVLHLAVRFFAISKQDYLGQGVL